MLFCKQSRLQSPCCATSAIEWLAKYALAQYSASSLADMQGPEALRLAYAATGNSTWLYDLPADSGFSESAGGPHHSSAEPNKRLQVVLLTASTFSSM